MVIQANNVVKGSVNSKQRAAISENIDKNKEIKAPHKKTSAYMNHMTTVQKQ